MSGKFFMVWGERKGAPTVMHATAEDARDEAMRLARQHPGHRFHVLETRGSACVPQPVAYWTPV